MQYYPKDKSVIGRLSKWINLRLQSANGVANPFSQT